jgi:hypothetical protein
VFVTYPEETLAFRAETTLTRIVEILAIYGDTAGDGTGKRAEEAITRIKSVIDLAPFDFPPPYR